jgi:hypothetical protein
MESALLMEKIPANLRHPIYFLNPKFPLEILLGLADISRFRVD